MDVFLTYLALASLISDALAAGGLANAIPFASPTPKSCDVLDGTGFTPKPTTGPVVINPLHQDLKRQAAASSNPNSADFYTCGWISGTLQVCEAYGQLVSDCIWNPQYSAIGCCTDDKLCFFYTTCLAYSELPPSCTGTWCSNSFTEFCNTYYPECAKVTYASGTDQYSSWYCATAQQPVQTLTITSGTVTFTNLPRYFKSYYGGGIGPYVHQHIALIVGCGVAGIVGIVAVIGWGWWRRRGRGTRRTPVGATPESQGLFAAATPLPSQGGQEYYPMYDQRGRGPPTPAAPHKAQYHQGYGNTPTNQTYSGQGYSNQPYDPAPVYRH